MNPKPDYVVIGIDPGKTGALCVVDSLGRLVEVMDLAEAKSKHWRKYSHVTMRDKEGPYLLRQETRAVYIEEPIKGYSGGNSRVGFAGVNNSAGYWRGVFESHGVRVERPYPNTWQTVARGMPGKIAKERVAWLIKQTFPDQWEQFLTVGKKGKGKVKINFGRTDAAGIALHGVGRERLKELTDIAEYIGEKEPRLKGGITVHINKRSRR